MSQPRKARKCLKIMGFHALHDIDASRNRIDQQTQSIALEKRVRQKTKTRCATLR